MPYDGTDARYLGARQNANDLALGESALRNGLGPTDLTSTPPPGLMQSLIHEESRGNPNAVSPKGALGLTQVMPDTARQMGYDPEELKRNPAMQVEAGTKYLMQQYQRFGNWRDALMAYNGGPERVARGEPPAESQRYADSILSRVGGQPSEPGSAAIGEAEHAGGQVIEGMHQFVQPTLDLFSRASQLVSQMVAHGTEEGAAGTEEILKPFLGERAAAGLGEAQANVESGLVYNVPGQAEELGGLAVKGAQKIAEGAQAVGEAYQGSRLASETGGIGEPPQMVPPAEGAPTELPPEAEVPRYHGSKQPIENLEDYNYSPKNVYGQGLYTTDNPEIAGSKGYKGKNGVVYQTTEKTPVKFLNLEDKPPPGFAEKINASGAPVDMDPNKPMREWFDDMRDESGPDTGISADTIQEYFEMARENAEQAGYGGWQHIGGKLTAGGQEHNVKVYFNPQRDLNITPYEPPPTPAGVQPEAQGAAAAPGTITPSPEIPPMQITPSAPGGAAPPPGGGPPPPPLTLTPEMAAQSLAEKQAAALQAVEAGRVPVAELKNPLAQPVTVPEAVTQARGAALNWDLDRVYGEPMEPSQHPAQMSAMVQVMGEEANGIRNQMLDVIQRAANGEDVSAEYPALANRTAAFAVQQAKLAGARSAGGRALEILNPLKPENLQIAETAKIAQQLMSADNPQQLAEMAAKLDPEGFARASRQMAGDVQAGGSLLGGLQEYYRANLLSNVGRTTSRVGLGNAITSLMQLPLRTIASIMPGHTIQMGEDLAKAKGFFDSLPEAIHYGLKSLVSGAAEKDLDSGIQYMETGPRITSQGTRWEDTTFGRGIDYLGHVIRLPFHGLAGVHQFGQALEAGSEENALAWRTAMQQAQEDGGGWKEAEPIYRKLLNNLPDDIRQQANQTARNNLFMGKFGPSGEWLAHAAQVPGLNLVATFMRVPMNIEKMNLQMMPGIGQLMDYQALTGGPSPERDLALARLTLGTIIQGYAAHKVVNGELTGDPPSNPTTRAALERQGVQWNSMKVGGKWVEIPDVVRPQMTLIANAVQTMHQLDSPTAGQVATALGVAMMHSLTSQSFMQGFSEMVQIPNEVQQKGLGAAGSHFIGSRLSGFVPASSLLRGITRAEDPTIRQAQTVLDTVNAGIPGLSGKVPAKWDLWGNVSEGLPGVPDNLLFPIHVTDAKPDKVEKEVADTGAVFRPVPKRIGGREQMEFDNPNDPNIGIELSQEQQNQWARLRGDGLKQQMSDIIDSDMYQSMPARSAARKHQLEFWGTRAASLATRQLLADNPKLMDDFIQNKVTKRSSILGISSLGAPP